MDENYQVDSYQNGTTLFVYYGIRVLVLIMAGVFFWWGDWESAVSTILIFILMLVPSILKERYRLYLPFALDLGIVNFVFLSLFLGQIGHIYEYIPMWDKFLHFQSGFLLGATGYILIYILNENENSKLELSPFFITLFAVAFSLAMGVLWEIAEFTGDSFFGNQWQASNADTMWDLIAAGVGSLIVSSMGYFWMHRNKRLPFTPWLMKIFRKKE